MGGDCFVVLPHGRGLFGSCGVSGDTSWGKWGYISLVLFSCTPYFFLYLSSLLMKFLMTV